MCPNFKFWSVYACVYFCPIYLADNDDLYRIETEEITIQNLVLHKIFGEGAQI